MKKSKLTLVADRNKSHQIRDKRQQDREVSSPVQGDPVVKGDPIARGSWIVKLWTETEIN